MFSAIIYSVAACICVSMVCTSAEKITKAIVEHKERVHRMYGEEGYGTVRG